MSNLTSYHQLQQERSRVMAQLERLNIAVSALNGTSTNQIRKRTIFTAGRARSAAAHRARWAKANRQQVVSIAARTGRAVSPSARRRIAAAEKARGAKWRKAKKGYNSMGSAVLSTLLLRAGEAAIRVRDHFDKRPPNILLRVLRSRRTTGLFNLPNVSAALTRETLNKFSISTSNME